MSWIKMCHDLPEKPEVLGIASFLKMDELSIIGRLWKLWTWADQHSLTGNAMSVTSASLDRITNTPGLAEALRIVGWLEGEDYSLSFPNFERHNGQTAKNRALSALRMQRNRSVTRASRERHQIREDKSTEVRALLETNSITPPVLSGDADVTPPLRSSYARSVTEALPADSVQHAEAELALREIAKRVYDEEIGPWGTTPIHDHWLNIALPIPRPRWDAFLWLYSLPADDEVFTDRKHSAYTQRRQTFTNLLRNLREECEKAFGLQKKYESSLGDIDAIPE
jgi:hypothetical protein